jgi:hypothetical protein
MDGVPFVATLWYDIPDEEHVIAFSATLKLSALPF